MGYDNSFNKTIKRYECRESLIPLTLHKPYAMKTLRSAGTDQF